MGAHVQSLPALIDTTSGTTIALAYAGAVTPGNTLVALHAWNSTSLTASVADSVNGAWTAVGSPGNVVGVGLDTTRFQAFYKIGTAAGTPTVTATDSGATTNRSLIIAEYSGIGSLSSSAYGGASSGSGTTQTGPAVTAAATSDVVVCFSRSQVSPSAIASPWTLRIGSQQQGLADVLAPAASTAYTPVWTVSAGGWGAVMASLVFAAAGGGGGGGGTGPIKALVGVGY